MPSSLFCIFFRSYSFFESIDCSLSQLIWYVIIDRLMSFYTKHNMIFPGLYLGPGDYAGPGYNIRSFTVVCLCDGVKLNTFFLQKLPYIYFYWPGFSTVVQFVNY